MQKIVASNINVYPFLSNLINIFDELSVDSSHFEEINGIQLYNLSKFITNCKKNELLVYVVDDIKIEIEIIILLFIYARYKGEAKYEQLAENQLEERIVRIFSDVISGNNDLLVIGCGLIYLLRNNFVEGEEDEILSEIDTILLKILINIDDKQDVDWYYWLYYFRNRLSYKHSVNWIENGVDFEPNIIYLLDCLKRSIQYGKKWDHRILSEIEKLHRVKIHPEKTNFLLSLFTSIFNERITFVIPLRIDSFERERNLDLILEQIVSLPKVDIVILEADKQSLYRVKKDYANVTYWYIEDRNPIFHRTKYLNLLLAKAKGAITCIWDTDVVIPTEQILCAIEIVRAGKAVMSFPYDGHFYMLSAEDSAAYCKEPMVNMLSENLEKFDLNHGHYSVGGAFIVNRKVYMEVGGENEYIIGWGPEDAERVNRMEILGLPVFRTQGSLFHLYHPRNENSRPANFVQELKNRKEFLKVCSMTKEELLEYIAEWANFCKS